MKSEEFKNTLELSILLSDCLESVTKELDNQINDPILQMKFNKVKTSTTQLNNTLSKWIDKEVLEPMGDYADKFRDNCEYFIKTYEDEKKN